MNSDPSKHAGRTSRIVDLLFGILFVIVAAAILVLSDQSNLAGSIAVALVVGGLGVDAVFSAVRGKRSLVSRIGPLP
jgi:hypothetical protein